MDKQLMSSEPVLARNVSQNITFNGSEVGTMPILAQDVTINCSAGNHPNGSSKVKLSNLVDYNWESKYYTGNLLAVHASGKYFAYALKGKTGGMVRVATHDSRIRALIKEMNGLVEDISFAHIFNLVVLGCVDEEGSLFVYNVEEKGDSLICTLQLHLVQDSSVISDNIHRVVWCPYLPDEDESEEENASKMLVLTHGYKAQLINVTLVNNKHGAGPLQFSELTEGFLEINEHSQPITDAAFSPDGTAMATVSVDGYVKFFQIYMLQGKEPRCLHEWKPHKGKPLSCLAFLDNHNMSSTQEHFWKFAITGCNNNTELKIWSCESWTCIQTINFCPNSNSTKEMFLKGRLDISASYLMLSDINNRLFYILEMHKDIKDNSAFARSITEFLLPSSVLSFAILEASLQKYRCTNSSEELVYPCDDSDEYEEGDFQQIVAVVSRMFVIQPKQLQECQIVFQPETEKDDFVDTLVTSSRNASDVQENVPVVPKAIKEEINHDLPIVASEEMVIQLNQLIQNERPKLANFNTLNQPPQPLTLMTPDAFNSPGKVENNDEGENIQSPLIKMSTSSPLDIEDNIKSSIEKNLEENDLINFQRVQKDNFASGGSSPSREVQEILSLNNANYNEYFENNKQENDQILNPPIEIKHTISYNEPTTMPAVDWPNIPLLKAKEVLKCEENNLGCRVLQDSLPESLIPTAQMNHNEKSSNVKHIEECMMTLIDLVREQHTQLEHLQKEVKSMKIAQEKCNIPEDLDNLIAEQLDLALSRSHAQQSKLFENWINTRVTKDREHQDALQMNLSHMINKQIHEKIQGAISLEMKQTVLPLIMASLDNLKPILKDDFAHKMNAIDQMMWTNLNKFMNSKVVVESLSNSLTNVLRPNMEKSYREAITLTLIPSWDRLTTSMFQQLNEVFQQGTKEYTQVVESNLDKSARRSQDKNDKIVSQMQNMCDSMKSSTDKMASSVPMEMKKQISLSVSSLQDAMVNSLSQLIKDQVSTAFKDHAHVIEDSVINAVRSRAVTPSPNDPQVALVQIQTYLAQGQINLAFQHALSASDLQLVVYLCEKLNPQIVFSQKKPLQQHVLLSLIQQLGADMNSNTDLKIRYLEEAVMNLDRNCPVTRDHVPTVLRELQRHLSSFLQTNPSSDVTRKLRMLQMAVQSLIGH